MALAGNSFHRLCPVSSAAQLDSYARLKSEVVERPAPGNLHFPLAQPRALSSGCKYKSGCWPRSSKLLNFRSDSFSEMRELSGSSVPHVLLKKALRHHRSRTISSTLQTTDSRKSEILEKHGTVKTHARADRSLSCTTFNILAPIYKRLSEDKRESELKDLWVARNNEIADVLSQSGSSIICLQEFWHDNAELVKIYRDKLGEHGYELHTLARTNNRGDGLLTAVKKELLEVVDYQKLLFHDCGDRVAQVLRLRYRKEGAPAALNTPSDLESNMDLLVVNTHLLFPHNTNSCLIRLRQVYKILEYLEEYKRRTRLPPMPILLCGDWNGSKRGQVYKFLRSQGFVSSYDIARQYNDNDHYKWVSHRNHRGNICGVDFIWLLNPSAQDQPLAADWKAAVFSMIKAKLNDVGLREQEAFRFFQSSTDNGDYVTLQAFQYAVEQLGLTGNNSLGLTREEIAELVQSADMDGNGVIDYAEFQRLFSGESMEETYARIRAATGIVELPWLHAQSSASLDCDPYPASRASPAADVTCQVGGRLSASGEEEVHLDQPLLADTMTAVDVEKAVDMEEKAIAVAEGTESAAVAPAAADVELMNFTVTDAFLFPPEVETGCWPDDYMLSDHAPLTAVFCPVLV